jgi:gliding motility-associated-like protein
MMLSLSSALKRNNGTVMRSLISSLSRFIIPAVVLLPSAAFAQLYVPNYTACPNQIITVTAQWPNVTITSLSLAIPAGGSAQNNGNLGTNTTFTISHPGPPSTWTLVGTGTNLNGTVTSTAYFNVTIAPPPPLTIANQINYCPGQTATLTADPGGNSYNLSGPVSFSNLPSNIITIPNLGGNHNGTYTVTSIGTCTRTGTTTIAVAPPNAIVVNTPSNICQGFDATLTAQANGGANWQWWYQQSVIASAQNHTLYGIQTNQSGAYVVTADYNFNGIACPMSATTSIAVVGTNPPAVAASPANVLCQGDKLSLTANAGGAVGYSWVGPASYGPVTIQSPTINPVIPNNSGVYTVTALFTNNFISCTTRGTVGVQVISVTNPVISMPSSVCENTSVQLSATAGTNVTTWTWFGPGFPGQTASGPTPKIDSIKTNGSGTYFLTVVYGTAPTTCAATASTQLNVVTVNSVTVIPPNPVCMPGHGYLYSSAIGANAYSWAGPNGYVNPGANSVVYFPTPANSGVYTVTAFFQGGNITCSNTNTVQLTVHPSLNFTLVPRQQVCYNSTVEVKGPVGADTYTWTSSTGFTSNSKNIYFGSVQPNNAGSYTLQVSLGPCITGASTSIEVLTPIQYTLTPKSRTVCQNDTIVIQAGVTGGSENYAYTWNPAVYFVGESSPFGPLKTAVPLGSIQYNLIVHDIACPHYTIGHVFDVTVLMPPKPQLELSTHNGCAPLSQKYDSKTAAEAWNTTYEFRRSYEGIRDSVQMQRDNFIYTLNDPGEYELYIYSLGNNGCRGTYKHPYPIVVNPRPGSEITWMPERPTTADEITFYPSYKNGEIIFHNWIFQGGEPAEPDSFDVSPGIDTSALWQPRRRYNSYGKFPVMLVMQNEQGCIDTVVRFMDVIDDMQVYIPNTFTPNGDGINDVFGVKGQGMKNEAFSMELSDRWGNVVYSTKDIDSPWDGKVRGVKAHDGVYLYKIKVVGMNGEGRKEYVGYFTLIK